GPPARVQPQTPTEITGYHSSRLAGPEPVPARPQVSGWKGWSKPQRSRAARDDGRTGHSRESRPSHGRSNEPAVEFHAGAGSHESKPPGCRPRFPYRNGQPDFATIPHNRAATDTPPDNLPPPGPGSGGESSDC